MTAVDVSVTPGPAQQLSGVCKAGSLIYNRDPSFAVWVGSNQTVRPGSGTLLGPLGNVNWTNDSPLFACVDTGVRNTIQLTVSDDVSSVDNPIAVAAATAALLLQQGIPSVFKNDVLGIWNAFFNNSIQPGASVAVNIYQYATLTFQVNSNPAGRVSLLMEEHQAPIGGTFDTIISAETFSVQDTAVSGMFAVPVIGQSAVFTNKGSTPLQLALYGNNRLLGTAQPINVSNQSMPRLFQSASVAAPASSTKIPLNSIDSGPNSTNFNGEMSVRFAMTSSVANSKPSFLIQMVSYDPTQARSLSVIDSAGFHQVEGSTTEWDCYMTLYHPVAVVQWQALMVFASTATVRFFAEFSSGA